MQGTNKSKTISPNSQKQDQGTNQYVPKFISQAPWYLQQKEEGLAHQKVQGTKSTVGPNEWYQRGVKQPAAYKYRKGACENCGAMTHQTKDCCERPRKQGAKWTGKDIQGDEVIQNFSMDYAAKRDRWSGYDPEMYDDVIQDYEQFEEARKQMRHKELEKANQDEEGHMDDEYKQKVFEKNDSNVAQDPKVKAEIKNLRHREDIADYLKDQNYPKTPSSGVDRGDADKFREQEELLNKLAKKEGLEYLCQLQRRWLFVN